MTKIGKKAFGGCSALKSINIPDSVREIGDWAFQGCNSLKSIKLPKKMTEIGDWTFGDCSSLASIVIPETVSKIGLWAFDGCIALESINIPDNVTEIRQRTFKGCNALKSIKIPNSVTNIWNHAFYGCSTLTSVNIPSSVTNIGYETFGGCSKLCEIIVHEDNLKYKSIDGILYSKDETELLVYPACKTDDKLIISNSVTHIDNYSFIMCSKLKEIIVSDGNKEYKSVDGVLYDKSGSTLIVYPAGKPDKEFEIPDTVHVINSKAFAGNQTLTYVKCPTGLTCIEDYAFYACTSLRNIKIPENVTHIKKGAFMECRSLPSVEIHDKVNTIEETAFSGCSKLEEFIVSDKNAFYKSIDGVLYNKDMTTLIAYPGYNKFWNFRIPNNVKLISKYAFSGCRKLEQVLIPNSVKEIEYRAFENCKDLTSIFISTNVSRFGSEIFAGCKKIKDFKIDDANPYYGFKCNHLYRKGANYILEVIDFCEEEELDAADILTQKERDFEQLRKKLEKLTREKDEKDKVIEEQNQKLNSAFTPDKAINRMKKIRRPKDVESIHDAINTLKHHEILTVTEEQEDIMTNIEIEKSQGRTTTNHINVNEGGTVQITDKGIYNNTHTEE